MSVWVPDNALSVSLPRQPVPADQVVEGAPQTGCVVLGSTGALEYGVWEMTPGAMRDIEVDETFVVISGRATVERTVLGHEGTWVLEPGVVLSLIGGEETVWRVEQTLRKVYFSPAE